MPNFFLKGKSTQGRADVAKRQAIYDGAVGARAIYDNKAYSFSSTYHTGIGTLQIYGTHTTAPTVPAGNPEYHTTQQGSYSLTHNAERFREGATTYRNNRDLAMTHRDSFIEQANERAGRMPIPSSTTNKLTP